MAKKVLCEKCSGVCCRYFALPIDKPKERGDFDDIRWYLCHKDVSVFVEDGDWYLNIKNKCRHLGKENRCAIYKNRPRICRGYKTSDCDLTDGSYEYSLHFTNDRQIDEYMKVKFDNNVTEKAKATRKGRKKKRK